MAERNDLAAEAVMSNPEIESQAKSPVPVGNSRSNILVVKPAQDRHGDRLTDGLDRAWDRRVLRQ
jgi:hypothetical protein